MVKIDIYDRILKLDRFKGSLEKYRRTKMLEGILPNTAQIVPMPTKDISGYVKDPYDKLISKHTPNLGELSEIIELIDRGCIALVNYGSMIETFHFFKEIIGSYEGYHKLCFHMPQGIPVMILKNGGPYR